MPSGVYVDVTIAGADDVIAPVDPDDNGKVLARNSSTGKYEHVTMAGGGNIAYTDAANVFTRTQTIKATNAVVLGSELLTNGDFNSGLTGWTDDSTGWSVVGGKLIHAPGVFGELTQSITVAAPAVYLVTVVVSGLTAGWVDVYPPGPIDVFADANGTFSNAGLINTTTPTIYIDVSSDFDGQIESVSVKAATSLNAPVLIFQNTDDSTDLEIRSGGIGLFNLFIGNNAGAVNVAPDGIYNLAIGDSALKSNASGTGNVALGASALEKNTEGYGNVAIGGFALQQNTTGTNNTSIGGSVLANNTTGYNLTAIGANALALNIDGHDCIAIGQSTLAYNGSGSENVAIGNGAFGGNSYSNKTGGVAVGPNAGANETQSNKLHIANNGTLSLLEGVMDSSATNQRLQVHAKIIIFADLPTSAAGLPTGALWNSAGTLKIA